MEILTVEQLCSNFFNFLSAESCAKIGCFLVMTGHYQLGVQGIDYTICV